MVTVISKTTPKEPVPAAITSRIAALLSQPGRIFGTPGASLTWGIDGAQNNDVSAGSEGEKQTAKVLAEFAGRHEDVRVFHSVRWPGSKGDTDHIVVRGNHVIIVDSKRWMSKRKYSVTARGAILRGTVAFPEGRVKMLPALQAWRKKLPSGVRSVGVVCIAQDKVFVPYDKNWYKSPFKLVTAEELNNYLESYFEKQKPETLGYIDLSIVTPIITNLIKARDRRREVVNIDGMKRE